MKPSALSAAEVQTRCTASHDIVLLDVRTPVEFATVHANRAINLPLDRITPETLASAGCPQRDQPVYILCHSGQRAARAADKLIQLGYTQPIVVTGGTEAWIQAGLPVTRGETQVISLERQVRIAAGALVFTGVMLARFVHPSFIWLSGFVGAGLMFAGITGFCGMGLLIARLPWNQRVS